MAKKILMTLALVLSMSMVALAGPREEVQAVVDEMNSSCPQDMGEGMSLNSVIMAGENVIMVFAMPVPVDMMPMVAQQAPMLKSAMLEGLKGDAESRSLLNNIKKMNGNLILSITSTEGECDPVAIVITPADI